jgi:glycosyltransferase involved in cell wall biosynthesis
MPKVSVIIPCYNQGEYVDEAVDSVLAQTFQDLEIIIINDGSTDEFTNKKLKNYNKPKTRVIHTENQGLAAARNNGIRASGGEYIFPLDADDKIANTYIDKAVKILDENKKIGILYCEAEFFGEQSGKWDLPCYNIFEFLKRNLIFCSAFYKRTDYNKTNGYDSNMIYGWEDWDFWLSLIEKGIEVFRIPETLFYYRIHSNSMVRKMDIDKQNYLQSIVVRNHPILYAYNALNNEVKELNNQINSVTYELEAIKKSRTYKLSLILAKPIKKIKKIINV